MPVEDKLIAMHARHAIAKTPLDISELSINCYRGCVELSGVIKRPRNFQGNFNVRKEFDNLKMLVRTAHGVKDVIAERVQVME
ncbi:MAG: hypothetical protein JO316_17655 [Abitibacteriaceae bacterium]|nr:hypothetical protein [Abditibacteriaceae bacterium]